MQHFNNLYHLDKVDIDILDKLYRNARATIQEIATGVGRSRVSVYRKIKNMEKAGVIEGYTVKVDWTKIGNYR